MIIRCTALQAAPSLKDAMTNNLTSGMLIESLLAGGRSAAYENFMLRDDEDAPIYPESIVQVEVAKVLKKRIRFSSVELEADTEKIAATASGFIPTAKGFPDVGRHGYFDIVCWQTPVPQVYVEVKDQLSGTDDGIVSDLARLQEFLKITHRLGEKAIGHKLPRFGALLYFVGKNSQKYKNGRHLAAQFEKPSAKTVHTTIEKLKSVLDTTAFDFEFKVERVIDSAKNGPPDAALIGTEHEETLSGHEQFTQCVVVVITLKT